MSKIWNNGTFRWVAGIVFTIVLIVGSWVIGGAVFTTETKAEIKAVDVKVETVKERVMENRKSIEANEVAHNSFQVQVVKDIGEIKISQKAQEKDIEAIKKGQERQEKMLGKIEEKL